MNERYRWHLRGLLVAVALFSATGSSCPRVVQQYASPLPRALPPSPTLEQVIQVVNNNSAQIQSFASYDAVLSGEGFPTTLRAVVAFQRPRRLRLRAVTTLTGPELDLGSNDELFWFWVRRNDPAALFFCRHDQYAASPARQAIVIDPDWLIESLGIVEFDPRLPHQNPRYLPGDRVEIRTLRETPQGPQTKITIVDAIRGCVLEQHLYDLQGRLVASTQASQHRRDRTTNLILPGVVTVRSIPGQFTARIDLGNVEINRLGADAAAFWAVPNYRGFPAVDLCDPRLRLPGGALPGAAPAGPSPNAAAANGDYRPR